MNETKNDELIYQIGLSLLPEVGSVKAKSLLAYCGSAKNAFNAKRAELEKIPGIGSLTALAIKNSNVLKAAEQELKFTRKEKIEVLFYSEANYPARLKQCEDGPLLLYYRGAVPLNYSRIIAIVGSRNATDNGRANCEKFLTELKELNVLILSGLAYGIDICAHKACLKLDIPTIAVLAHGLDSIYPSQHKGIAHKMCELGGLLTEFPSGTTLHPDFFPRRNRIIAGMADALIVVEAGMRSGSLVTATLANDYNRDVFAVPGRLNDITSEGCNHLIKTNKASLLQSVKDIEYLLGWEKKEDKKSVQTKLFRELTSEEDRVVNLLKNKKEMHIDELTTESAIKGEKLQGILLQLEFDGVLRSKPGKQYSLQ